MPRNSLANAPTLLRARGGISIPQTAATDWVSSSPRTRRYFLMLVPLISLASLFSAHAEVFPFFAATPS